MKLNYRIWLIIVPIVILVSIFVSTSAYYIEKKAFIKKESININLQFKKMLFVSSNYINFSDAYFYSLLNSYSLRNLFSEKNEALLANSIENNLTELALDLSKHDIGNLVLAVINPDDEMDYYFESHGDPFSSISQELLQYAKKMRKNRHTLQDSLLDASGNINIIRAKLIDPITMRAPVSRDMSKSKMIILKFELLSLYKIITELRANGYNISLYKKGNAPAIAKSQYQLSVNENAFYDYWLSINYKDSEIEKHLLSSVIKLFIYSLAFVFIVSFSLLYFISKNITNPILILRKKILAVNEGKSFPEPIKKNDEISLLNLAFYDLYSQLKDSYDDSQVIINTDYLTKLNNRKVFNTLLERLISRNDKKKKISLLYIDIDNFKHVNDNYGHEAGDVFLIEFATALRSLLRPTDMVFDRICDVSRLAGDEFGVVIYDYKDDAIIKHIALRILSVFKDGFDSSVGNLPVSASIGISVYPRDGTSHQQLIINADAAMYQAKNNGKNQYAFFSQALAEKAKREFQVELQLKNIDFAEFTLLFMPIIDVKTERPIGVEALIRWLSADLGQVPPAEFIPLAEKKGHFKQIDLWVFKSVLQQFSVIQEVIGSHGKVSINISAAQLDTNDFIQTFIETLTVSDVAAENLILEITETFSTKMTPLVQQNLALLKDIGFLLALDDFGSGYTSIIQLIDYPVDIIKIDKSMIDRIENQGSVIVSSLTKLCQANGYSVTAEGVENVTQANILKGIGVNNIQGFYYCKPMSLRDLKNKYGKA